MQKSLQVGDQPQRTEARITLQLKLHSFDTPTHFCLIAVNIKNIK